MSPNINIQLDDETYASLQSIKLASGCRTWDLFFKKIATGEVEVDVEFLEIDGDQTASHTIVFRLGEFIYKFENGEFTPIKTPVTQWKVRQALKATKGLKFG